MALPKQIRKQMEDVKNIETDINAVLVAEDKVDQSQAEIDALLEEVTPTAEVTKLHPDKTEDPTGEAPKPERTDWKQKYNVLQGKYDAEVPRMAGELRTALSRIGEFEIKSEAPVHIPEEVKAVLTPEEIADYGEDLIGVIERKAREMAEHTFEPMVADLRNQVTMLSQKVGVTGQKMEAREQNEVLAMLDRDVKDWRVVNTSQAFKDWLELVDPFSGQTRKKLLLDGYDAKDALRVKSFFEGFLMENAAVSPGTTEAPAGEAGNPSTLKLEDYVAPGTPKGGGQAGAPKEKRKWTRKEVGAFYSGVQKGHYKNRPEDKARIEADIVAATTEGRIIP